MKIALLTIGDELLEGFILDTNSQYLAKGLFDQGIIVEEKASCRDAEVSFHLRELLKRNDLVITTGGLGPTHDDKTVESIAAVARVPIEYSLEVQKDLEKRYGALEGHMLHQTRIPKGAKVLLNEEGAAPSLIVTWEGKYIIALPGIPHECKGAFHRYVSAFIQAKSQQSEKIYSHAIHFWHMNENRIAPTLLEIEKKDRALSIGIYPSIETVSVIMRKKASSKEKFEEEIKEPIEKIVAIAPNQQFFAPSGQIVEALHLTLLERKMTLAVAESCTGGLIGSKIAAIAGASDYFLGGVIVYANPMKVDMLDINPSQLEKEGAVSRSTVEEMCNGLFRKTKADIALAISGIAGPSGGTKEKPVGTIYGAIGIRGEAIYSGLIPIRPNLTRAFNQEKSACYLLGALFTKLKYNLEPFSI